MQVSALARYPIKSCRGIALDSVRVQPWGFLGDRRWMLVDADGKCITAREYPELVLVDVELPELGSDAQPVGSDGGRLALRIHAPGRPVLELAEPTGSDRELTTIFRHEVRALPAAETAHAWFSDLLGTPARLMFLDDPTSRPVDPDFAEASDVVSLADGYPVLLANVNSLAAVNDLVLGGRWSDEAPMSMTRFRPNLVISGAPAWAEDRWRRIRVGGVDFRVAKGCARCVLTTIDPRTAEKGHEPLATLGRHRNWDGKVWFGVNLIPEVGRAGDAGVVPLLHVGDTVEVLEER